MAIKFWVGPGKLSLKDGSLKSPGDKFDSGDVNKESLKRFEKLGRVADEISVKASSKSTVSEDSSVKKLEESHKAAIADLTAVHEKTVAEIQEKNKAVVDSLEAEIADLTAKLEAIENLADSDESEKGKDTSKPAGKGK